MKWQRPATSRIRDSTTGLAKLVNIHYSVHQPASAAAAADRLAASINHTTRDEAIYICHPPCD